MKMCVGAVSRRVIEEAASAHVVQIVASRRQVDVGGGYTGLDQGELVDLVRSRTRVTEVVRDHGGPGRGADPDDDGVASFDADVAAGFDRLHLDVCELQDQSDRHRVLRELVKRYHDMPLEIGAEHDNQSENDALVGIAIEEHSAAPLTAVIDTGAYIWNDRQVGEFRGRSSVRRWVGTYHRHGILTKGHNLDWVGRRHGWFDAILDYYNLAPEFAEVEVDALLHVLPWKTCDQLLEVAHASGAWRRWFDEDLHEGTWDRRARCAVRYVLELPEVQELTRLDNDQEAFVRGRIQAALRVG